MQSFTCFRLLLLTIFLFSYSVVANYNSLPTAPNIQYMMAGMDMKYGSPLNATLRDPIFDYFTYDEQHMVTISGINYKMPDQLYILAYPSEDATSTTMVYYSVSMVEDSLFQTFTAGFDCKHINGSFGLSEQVNDFNYMFSNYSSYTANSYLTVTCSKTKWNGLAKLNPSFKKSLDQLPSVYDSTTCKYFMDFFKLFGTCYTYEAVFGGYVSMSSSFSTTLTYSKDTEQISFEIGAQFLMFTANSTTNWNSTSYGQELDQTYDSNIYLMGGDPSQFNPDQYQEWVATVPNNPLMVRANIRPISDWIIDNPDKKIAMSQALSDYYANNYSC